MFLYVCDDIYDVAYRAIILIHSQDGWSSVMFASALNHVEVVKMLIEGGAIVNTQNKVWYFLPQIWTVHFARNKMVHFKAQEVFPEN